MVEDLWKLLLGLGIDPGLLGPDRTRFLNVSRVVATSRFYYIGAMIRVDGAIGKGTAVSTTTHLSLGGRLPSR